MLMQNIIPLPWHSLPFGMLLEGHFVHVMPWRKADINSPGISWHSNFWMSGTDDLLVFSGLVCRFLSWRSSGVGSGWLETSLTMAHGSCELTGIIINIFAVGDVMIFRSLRVLERCSDNNSCRNLARVHHQDRAPTQWFAWGW